MMRRLLLYGRKRWILVAAGLLCGIAVRAGAQPAETLRLYDQGNALYAGGEYERAVASYEQALETGYASGALFFNLGNAYYRLDEIGQAIRYYEKSRRLLPDEISVQHNLEIARSRTADQFSQVPEPYWENWWQRILFVLGVDGLFLVGLVCYLTAAALLANRILYAPRKPWHRRALAVAAVSSVILLGAAYLASIDGARHHSAVVIADAVSLRREPASGAPVEMDIHEGVVVDVVDAKNGWIEVRLPNGVTGWIAPDVVAEI